MQKKRFLLIAGVCCLLLAFAGAQELRLKGKVSVHKVLPGGIAFSPDGRYAAFNGISADFDVTSKEIHMSNIEHVILLVEAGSGKVKRELFRGGEKGGLGFLGGRGDPVAFSPDGRLLMAVYDSAIHVWEAEKGKKIGVWGQSLEQVAFSPDRSFALARHSDDTYEALDLRDGHSLGSFQGEKSASLLPLDRERPSIVFLRDKNVVLKNLKTGGETPAGELGGTRIAAAALSPNGKLLAVTTDSYDLGLWSLAENRKIFERPGESKKGAEDPLFSPDGSVLVYQWKGKLAVRSLASESETETDFEHQHPFGVGEMTFADAQTLATRGALFDPQVMLWSLSSPAGGSSASAASRPATGSSEGFSLTLDRSGNVISTGAPASSETSRPVVNPSGATWQRWSTRGTERRRVARDDMSPGPGLKPGNVYLEVALTLENVSGQKEEFKYPHRELFLRHRSLGQRIEPRDITNETLRKTVGDLRRQGILQNLSKDFVFSVSFVIEPGKKEEFAIVFEIPQEVSLDDLELYLPGAPPVILSGSR